MAADAASAAMDRYARGDDRAFAELYDLLAPRLYGFLIRKAGDRALAEDLVQQTFLHMHRARATYVTGADVVPWAFALARNLTIDAFRRRRRELLSDTGDLRGEALAIALDMPADERLQAQQAADCMQHCFAELPDSQRTAFELLKRDGLSLAQAAETLGISVGAVKVRAHRAYEALREALRAHLGGEVG